MIIAHLTVQTILKEMTMVIETRVYGHRNSLDEEFFKDLKETKNENSIHLFKTKNVKEKSK